MATLASKSGTQNFTDTWAVIDATSANITEGGVSTYTAATTSYVACPAFTPGAITIDGIGLQISLTSLTGLRAALSQDYGTFSVRLAQGGVTVANTEVTVNVVDLAPLTFQSAGQYGDRGEILDKIDGGWVFFKFGSNVSLAAATAYTVDIKKSNSTGAVSLGYSGAATNWLRYLRTTNLSAGAPAASDRLFICGEITGAGAWSTNTVNHDLTSSANTYGRVDIGAYGRWNWNTAASTNYYFKTNADIRLGTLGQLQIGTAANPIPSTSTATIDFVSASGGGCVLHCSRKSTITMNGPTKKLGYLTANIAAGASTAVVSDNKLTTVDPGWKNGDKVIFAPHPTTSNAIDMFYRYDTVTLNADSSAGTITWSSAINHNAQSQATTWHPHNPYQPWVANLTRNIVIKGASTTNTCAFNINTDQVNMVGVEIYYTDAVYIAGGDSMTAGLMKNCVVREGRSRATDTTGAGGGIMFRGGKNFTLDGCIVSRANGIGASTQINGNMGPINELPIIVKNCVIIGNNLNNYGSLFDTSDAMVTWDSCVITGSIYPQIFKVRSKEYVLTNCEFGPLSNNIRLKGIRSYSTNNGLNFDNFKFKVSNCTFYETPVDPQGDNMVFESCTFKKFVSGAAYFLYPGYWESQNAYAVSYALKPIIFNDCTFNTLAATKDSYLFYTAHSTYMIFNGGSFNCTNTFYLNHATKVQFNNMSTPNWGTAFPHPSAGNLKTFTGTTDTAGNFSFQRFNQTEGDHRHYSMAYNSFSDSAVYDSSPRSLRVYSFHPSGLSNVNSFTSPIRIPLKKNQSATITAKIKLSPPESTYVYTGDKTAFHGRIPSLIIRANRALGSNFNSDTEIYASASAFNGTTSSAGWVPTDLGSSLRLWLSTENLSDVTYDATTKLVSQWNDRSGLGNHLTQSTDSKKPLLKTSIIDPGLSSVSLTSVLDQKLVSSGNILTGNTSNVTLFWVGTTNAQRGGYMSAVHPNFYSFNGATSRMMGYICGPWGSDNYQFHFHALESGTTKTNISGSDANEGPLFNSLMTIGAFKNNNGSSLRKPFTNNNPAGSMVSNANTVNITPTSFSLGCGIDTSITGSSTTVNTSAAIDFYEFIVVDKQMTATEWADMHKYLGNKYNISVKPDIGGSTSWQTVSWSIPAVTDDTVVEANLNIRAANNGLLTSYCGYINIDSITVT